MLLLGTFEEPGAGAIRSIGVSVQADTSLDIKQLGGIFCGENSVELLCGLGIKYDAVPELHVLSHDFECQGSLEDSIRQRRPTNASPRGEEIT